MIKAYKYRIYPNKEQTAKLQWTLDRCRELHNAALQERKEAYKYAGKRVTCFDQINDIPEIRNVLRPEYQEITAEILHEVLRRLDKAFQAFFRRAKNGEHPGYPRFQGQNRYNSFAYPHSNCGWKLVDRTRPAGKKGIVRVDLRLSKIGIMKLCLHRDLIGKVRTLTIKREGEHWYAVFACEVKQEVQYHPSEESIGIDLGLSYFATLSTGETIDNPRYYRKAEEKLKKLQRVHARKKRGSRRARKAAQAIGRAHRKVINQRVDFSHKESLKLAKRYQVIVLEKLAVVNMVKRPAPKKDETGKYLPNGVSAKAGLNKSIQDAGWTMFVEMCSYKAEWAGGAVIQVNPRHTSQICSGCGAIAKKELSERWHSCSCGCEMDRDHNAAVNILRIGLATRTQ